MDAPAPACQPAPAGLPAVVAIGYDRPDALARLLGSLRAGSYPPGVPLVISLDRADDNAALRVAEAFEWPHGPKRVIRQPERLGLREHVLRCGDLSAEYGAVILFEDDLLAAPHHHAWVRAAIATYAGDPRVAGIALYSYRLNEFNNLDFEPLDDGSDVYFLQVAASWGQAWTAAQWSAFRAWYAANRDAPIRVADGVPRQLEAWRANSWKRYFIKYLVATGRTFVYPRPSLSTNMAEAGTNTRREVGIYQSPLDLRARAWRTVPLDRSLARYDVFYEPLPEVLRAVQPALGEHDFDVDLFGTKPREALRRPMLLSARPARGGAARFGLIAGASPAAAIAQAPAGGFFTLAGRGAFGRMTLRRRHALARATQSGSALGRLAFQLLKPLQTELTIRRRARAGDG